jgi:exonuclease SbcD
MDFKFIHTADVHLDSPLLGLERYEGAPVELVRGATRKALQNLVKLALDEMVDFVLIAGDLYDGDWRDYNTGLFFTSQMARLREADIPVYLVRGNHDAASIITHRLRLPDNVKDLSTQTVETVLLEEKGVAIHGRGYHTPAVMEDLSRSFPDPLKDYFNIGLLHTSAGGREGHENYAPCDPAFLAGRGYSYWALGHVHRKEVLWEEPWIVFPGNIQGRHVREEGRKGCTLVRVRGGRVESVEHPALDVLRWCICEVDAAGARSVDDILVRAGNTLEKKLAERDGRLLAVRFILAGACPVHGKLLQDHDYIYNNLRAVAADCGANSVWVEKVKINTYTEARLEDVMDSHPVAYLMRYIRDAGRDERLLQELIRGLERDKNALPSDLFRDGEMDPGDPGYLRRLLPEVEELIISRLLRSEDLIDEN